MNIYLVIILAILLGNYLLSLLVGILNLKSTNSNLPGEFQGYYDPDKYIKSQKYLRENTTFKIIHSTVFLGLVLLLMLSGGFNAIDLGIRALGFVGILRGLLFFAILFLCFQIIDIPFSLYNTFVIEQRYDFNRTTLKTFILDILKGWFLTIVIGGLLLGGVIWFFEKTGYLAWLWCWIGMTLFQIFFIFIAPVVIMPIFNKFIPLEDGELKKAIKDYADSQKFKIKGIFTMDGSKRSSKSNAFFTGFGKFKRIVLFDTLIKKHTVGELVSVLAHEIGHYKKRHILKHILIAIFTNGLMFFILSLFINNPGLFLAFRMENISIYASLLFFSFLYTPISLVLSIAGNIISRKHEFQADEFAVLTYQKPEDFILALKKLTVDNLSNLTPHWLNVFLNYSHPPVLKRIERIRSLIA